MAELKTKPTDDDVLAFLNSIEHEQRKKDCLTLLPLFEALTGEPPKLWGKTVVGFGSYHYKYKTGREGDWYATGFSPRKQNLTIYIMPGFDRYDALMSQLGKFKTGVSCLYVKKLADINLDVLNTLVKESTEYIQSKTWA